MKGTEVIEIFEKNGLLASELVDAVYDGLYPVHFGAVLKPHNCLTCIYAEPPAEATQAKTDPGACHNPIPRKYKAGLSYCSHTRLGEANGLVPENGMEGTCKGGYSVIEDADLLERLKDCEFVWAEVEEYLDDLLPGRHRTPLRTLSPPESGQIPEKNSSDSIPPISPSVAEKHRSVTVLSTIPGTAWDQIQIRIAKNERYEIARPGYKMEFYNTQELGLQKARTKLALLKGFGLNAGELKKDCTKDVTAANIRNLRADISRIFPDVEGDPIPCICGRYVCQFQISVSEEEFSRDCYTKDDVADEDTDWLDIMDARS